ncbi:hypothetical protein GobsT_37490 [Gemmata obscuriglobus]|uniref:Uncharacterized protein n=1 Tax=Gemmata obscuriglobus TaxID=114 RepID=A0A2Z3H1E2_9BACT|nr:hypothetical protein [Gemmata obscuriglobus]AWM38152.1 hypothetical protein C1280_14900 [Gemmata obscuriglobus]QEG28960.1 hypothetical protein GobsT_37490 [Gemmata obscuriglobus]VTS07495.1 Uncharacterized protein OS=Clostridium saccharobutylicum DSM 13864 GN=CLSA_c16290 PE=4 SV=1 [Gemmata obscuriglobus UQM 2246]
MVFTRQELIAELPRVAATDSPRLEVTQFEGQDFVSPDCEESIWAFLGWKRDFASGLRFWMEALQAQGWSGRETYFRPYAEAGLCEPITAHEFARLVAEYGSGLRRPLPPYLVELTGYRSGLRMYADWNDVAAVAAVAETFVAFFWSTTA